MKSYLLHYIGFAVIPSGEGQHSQQTLAYFGRKGAAMPDPQMGILLSEAEIDMARAIPRLAKTVFKNNRIADRDLMNAKSELAVFEARMYGEPPVTTLPLENDFKPKPLQKLSSFAANHIPIEDLQVLTISTSGDQKRKLAIAYSKEDAAEKSFLVDIDEHPGAISMAKAVEAVGIQPDIPSRRLITGYERLKTALKELGSAPDPVPRFAEVHEPFVKIVYDSSDSFPTLEEFGILDLQARELCRVAIGQLSVIEGGKGGASDLQTLYQNVRNRHGGIFGPN